MLEHLDGRTTLIKPASSGHNHRTAGAVLMYLTGLAEIAERVIEKLNDESLQKPQEYHHLNQVTVPIFGRS